MALALGCTVVRKNGTDMTMSIFEGITKGILLFK